MQKDDQNEYDRWKRLGQERGWFDRFGDAFVERAKEYGEDGVVQFQRDSVNTDEDVREYLPRQA